MNHSPCIFYRPDRSVLADVIPFLWRGRYHVFYLVYFVGDERGDHTVYRMSRSLRGPWLCPADDSLGGRNFCAAKTAGDGKRCFAFSWLPTLAGERDAGKHEWGGNLVLHELIQHPDGPLEARMPSEIARVFTQPIVVAIGLRGHSIGTWALAHDTFTSNSPGRFSAFTLGKLPDECLVEMTLRFEPGVQHFGLLLRANDNIEQYYRLRLDPNSQRMSFDRCLHRAAAKLIVERPLAISRGQPITLRVITSGTCLVAYANDRVALSARMYDFREGRLGLFVAGGVARFDNIRVKVR